MSIRTFALGAAAAALAAVSAQAQTQTPSPANTPSSSGAGQTRAYSAPEQDPTLGAAGASRNVTSGSTHRSTSHRRSTTRASHTRNMGGGAAMTSTGRVRMGTGSGAPGGPGSPPPTLPAQSSGAMGSGPGA